MPILEDRRATWADAEQLTFDQAFIEFVSLFPDGRQLLVSSDCRGNEDLWLLPAHGGELVQVTSDPAPDWDPEWSPDGREIAFYSLRSGNQDIWVTPVTGGAARQVTIDPSMDAAASWSPDGTELAFVSARSGNYAIWIAARDGGDARRLTKDPPAVTTAPEWSSDGKWIAFSSNRGYGFERIYRIPVEGGEAQRLTKGPGNTPRWSLDGSVIYFVGVGDRPRNLWAVSLPDRREFPVTDFRGRVGQLGPYALAADTTYLYFTWEQDLGDIWDGRRGRTGRMIAPPRTFGPTASSRICGADAIGMLKLGRQFAPC